MSSLFNKLWNRLKPEQRFTQFDLMKQGHKNLMFAGFAITDDRTVVGSIWDSNKTAGIPKQDSSQAQKDLFDLFDFLDSGLDLKTWYERKKTN